MLWLWHRPVATALIHPLAWEPPYIAGVALERRKERKKVRKRKKERKKEKEREKAKIRNKKIADIFPKTIYRWPTGTLKRCSRLLVIRKMQIKTTRGLSPHTCQNGFDQIVYK